MAQPVINGVAVGSCIAVDTTAHLSTLDMTGITLGTKAFTIGTSETWELKASTASVSSIVLAVNGITGWRWVKTFAPGANTVFDDAMRALGKSATPTLTQYSWMKLGTLQAGTITVPATPAIDGGGLASGGTIQYVLNCVSATPKASSWFVAWRGKLTGTPSAAGATSFGGLFDGTGANGQIQFGQFGSQSTTQWVLRCSADGVTFTHDLGGTIDANAHNFALSFDGTTLTAWVDSVAVTTRTTLTSIPTGTKPLQFNSSGTGSGLSVTEVTWGYVAI